MTRRREFLRAATFAGLAAGASPWAAWGGGASRSVKPARLRPGDTVGLIHPAGATFLRQDLEIVMEALEALGLKGKLGAHALDRYGYLAGRDEDRAADVNAMFADPEVRAVLAVRGGWGCARILPYLDYDLLRAHPKILMGYSDVTALLLAIHARTDLITFHGPVGISSWCEFSVSHMRRVLFEGEAFGMQNPVELDDSLAQQEYRIQTIRPGRARGRLLGGNLTVICHMLGTGYLPDWQDAILFVEDINEDLYRVDRMLTHLKLAGVLSKLRGFVFGSCLDCDPGSGYGSLTLEELFDDHVKPLGVPAWQGAMIGHMCKQFTLPVGGLAEIDAQAGSIRLLEPAVV